MKIVLAALLSLSLSAFAQSPPQIPLTGNIGVPGSVAILGGVTVQMPSDANYTLTPAQWSNKTLIITSATSLTATRNIVAPLNKGQEFNVENTTTGGQSIVIIGASGTGVTIANGASAAVFTDGTNYIQKGSSSAGVALQTNGAANSSQSTLNLVSGINVAVTNTSGGNISVSSTSNCPTGVAGTIQAASGTPGTCAPATSANVITALGFTPLGQTPLPSGLLADYNFLQGSGTVLIDNSGNGNNGTLGGGSSTVPGPWTTTGLSFNTLTSGAYDGTGQNGIQLPSALNASRSILFAGYLNILVPVGGIAGAPHFPVFITSSLGGSGLNLMNWVTNPSLVSISQYGEGIFAGGTSTTQAPNQISGFHIFGWTFGTGSGDLDHLYIDGVEVASYVIQGHSAGLQTSGNLYIGSSNTGTWTTNNTAFFGTAYRAQFYSAELTPAQMQTATGVIRNDVSSRGVPVVPIINPVGNPILNCIGDSITYGLSATPYCSQLTLDANQPNYIIKNWGIDSITIAQINGMDSNRAALYCKSSSGPAIAEVMAGTNDLTFGFSSVSATVSFLAGEVSTLKNAGCGKVYIGTMISRTGTCYGSATCDADKDLYDAQLLKQWKAIGADGVIDFAADPRLGADGAYGNPSPTACAGAACMQGDGIHPTTAGQLVMANEMSNVLNYYGGSTAAAPNVITGATATLVAGNRYNVVTPAITTALTLPDCTGNSGVIYTFDVTNANAVTVTGASAAQTVNGSSSAVTLPATRVTELTIIGLPKTTAGCVWSF